MTCPKELEEALQKLEAKEKNAALYCGVDDAIFIRSPAAKEAIKAVLRRQILLCVERGKRLFFLTGLTWFEIFAGEVLEEIKKELPEINYWLLSFERSLREVPLRRNGFPEEFKKLQNNIGAIMGLKKERDRDILAEYVTTYSSFVIGIYHSEKNTPILEGIEEKVNIWPDYLALKKKLVRVMKNE